MTFTPSFTQRFLLCLLSAFFVVLSFPNFLEKTLTPPTAFLGWIALVPFFIALQNTRPHQGAFWGFLFGFLQFGGILYWIGFLEAAEYLSGVAWLALVAYLSLYPMLFGWLYSKITGKIRVHGMWIAPFLWVGLEYMRGSRPWGGFSWGELGYSQAPYPSILVATSVAGVYGLTFMMVWVNACLASGFSRSSQPTEQEHAFSKKQMPRWAAFVLPSVLILLLILGGNLVRNKVPIRKAGTVALLQPSVDQSVKWNKKSEDMIFSRMEKLALSAARTKPDLIVWPETAAPSYLLITPTDRQRVVSIVRRTGTPHLVGCLDAQKLRSGMIGYFNAAVAFNFKGTVTGVYHKRHLVPFGEFVPFQKYLTFLGPVVGDLGSFEPGKEYVKLAAHGFTYSPMICYEVIFPGDVQEAVRSDPDALVNISNDAWYGKTASPYQHAMMAVVRSAEERMPLLRSANTGICLATDPFGKILGSTQIFEEKFLTADVLVANRSRTLYSRWGNWLPWSCIVITILLLLLTLVRQKDRKIVGPVGMEQVNG